MWNREDNKVDMSGNEVDFELLIQTWNSLKMNKNFSYISQYTLQ